MEAKMVKTKLNGKYEIILPEHRAQRPEWYSEKGWEKARLDSMHQHLGKDDVIYYVGAEEGEMAALCQMWGAKVVMFEPNPKAWSHIRSIWMANKLDHPAGIFPGFASDVTKKAEHNDLTNDLAIVGDYWPRCSQYEMEAAHGFKELDKEANTFDQIKIDDYVFESKLIPTAISLDVEGSEGRVLRGAEMTLLKFHPKIWLSLHPEFLHEQYGEWGAELRKWIRDIGYQEELLAYDHEVHLFYHV